MDGCYLLCVAGLNGVDNGRLWLDNFRVPRSALLDKLGMHVVVVWFASITSSSLISHCVAVCIALLLPSVIWLSFCSARGGGRHIQIRNRFGWQTIHRDHWFVESC